MWGTCYWCAWNQCCWHELKIAIIRTSQPIEVSRSRSGTFYSTWKLKRLVRSCSFLHVRACLAGFVWAQIGDNKS
jgi:hypothetical protein